MKCPKCGKETKKGIVKASYPNITNALTQVLWTPEEDIHKAIQKNNVELSLQADGYYCDECMMVFAEFKER
ncbi:MAG: hypothetical protein IJ875_06650 [Solobacterium sp.]|nr:hypothetical protein [Solobacterium sp.]